MPMMILNLTLLFVLGLAPVEFLLWHRENLLHRFSEFIGRLLDLVNRGWHSRTIHSGRLFEQATLNEIPASLMLEMPKRFEILASRPLDEVCPEKFVEMKFSSFSTLPRKRSNLIGLQCAVCGDKAENACFNWGTV